MGWNGSENKNAAPVPKKAVKTPPSKWRGLIALAIVVALGCAGVWWFVGRGGGQGTDRPTDIGKHGAIAEVKPDIATNKTEVAETPKPKTYAEMSREEKIKMYEDRYGTNMPMAIQSIVYYLKNPPKQTYHQPKTRVQIFKNRSDRKIASMLLVKPGNFMLRKPTFDDKFDSDFVANLHSNEEITDEDSAEDRELKQAVADTKKELSKQVRETGMKPSEIMNSESSALFELGRYKRDLEKELRNIKRDATMSDDDVRDFVTAANKMLEAKGVPGFKMPNMLVRQATLSGLADKEPSSENAGNKDKK